MRHETDEMAGISEMRPHCHAGAAGCRGAPEQRGGTSDVGRTAMQVQRDAVERRSREAERVM